MKWRRRLIGDFIEAGLAHLQTGPFGTQLKASDYLQEGTPVINVRNIGFGNLRPETLEHVGEETTDRLSAHLLRQGDIVFGRKGAVDRHLYVCQPQENWMQGSDCIRLRFETDEVSSRFVSCALLTGQHQQWMLSQAGNRATMASLNQEIISRIVVSLPPREIQDRVVEVLSAYDDLIENNRQRMVLLEKAARLLYEEWFVRLHFPGHERTRMIGGIPEGWERKPLSGLCERIDYGYTASAEQEETGPKFLRITDIVSDFIDWSVVPYCPIDESRLEKFRLAEGDIVVARTGATVGYAKRLHKRHPQAVFASYLVRFRLKPQVSSLMVGIFVESDAYKRYVHSRVGGAAQPNASAPVLADAQILVPPPALERDFDASVEPLVDEGEILQMQNQHLRTGRDLLLPRLMSGEIAV